MAPSCSTNHGSATRKRVPKACDRCRLKKVKCDGNMPCPRCKMEDAVCHFGQRRKSIERSISAGYVDQIELQQKILIKALKETWTRWAPSDLRLQAGPEPSIHTIVRALDVVQSITGHQQPVPSDFTFDETLTGRHGDAFETSIPDFDTIPTFSTPSPQASTLDDAKPVFSHKDSMSTVLSRAQSVAASTDSPIYSFSPLSTQLPDIKTELENHSPTSGRAPRPTFCPLPPRLNMMPVVPIPLDMSDSEPLGSFDDYQQSAFPMMSEWQLNPNNTGLDTSLMPPLLGMDFAAYPNQIATPEAWNSWVSEHPEYATLDLFVWSRFLSYGR